MVSPEVILEIYLIIKPELKKHTEEGSQSNQSIETSFIWSKQFREKIGTTIELCLVWKNIFFSFLVMENRTEKKKVIKH